MKNTKLLIPILGLFIFSACEKVQTETQNVSEEFCIPDSLMNSLTFDTVRSENVLSELKLTGKITFNEDKVVRVFPLVSGHVSEVNVSVGDFVKKGQTLALVMSSDMAGFTGEYKSAESELAIAKKNLEVTKDMKNTGISSDRDIANAENEYQKALSAFTKMKETMNAYGQNENTSNGSEYYIKAPMSGFIVDKNVSTGMELRQDDANSLFVISDLNDVWAIASVYETDISKIKEGDQANVTTLSYPDKIFNAKVEKVSNIINPETNTMSVKIRLENPQYLLKPGMFANILLKFPAHEKMLSLKTSSVLYDDNKSYVVSYNKRCDVSLREVNIVNSTGDIVFFQSDSLNEGNFVINRNNLFVLTALKKR